MDSSTTELPDTTIPAARPKPKLGSLRALWPFVRRHTGLFVAWLLALACSSGATLTLPVAFRQMIDHGFSSGTNIDRTFSLVFAVVVVLALATAARFFFVSLLGERVVADLRNRRDVLGPVLARLFTPQAFGVFTTFSTVAATGAVVACGRYEFALPMARDEDEAAVLLALCARIGLLVLVLSVPLAALLNMTGHLPLPWLLRVQEKRLATRAAG